VNLVREQSGQSLERDAAAETVVRSLGSLERRGGRVQLPVEVEEPAVTAGMLAPALRRARVALSAPVYLRGETRQWRLPRARVAELLSLPREGGTRLAIAGAAADAYFRALAERVGTPPVDAGFVASGDRVRVVPARDGTELDVPLTARRLLRAATSPANRTATLVVARAAPERSTAEARAMGIDRRMSSYKTYYSGTADRITNLRLGVTLLDGSLVPPGGTFSLNSAIGERTVERGFRPAPVIIGTEFAEEVGGGTSQIATTVFNAAWEAGLQITERNPHSLYISRYQLGRDATVYWPSLDLKFQNDTKSWVLVKGFAESDGIRVGIYGGEQRRVESSAGTMSVTGSPPVKRVKDPTLPKGRTVIEEAGSSPSRTSVTRTVYGANGEEIRTETWNTSYKGETRIVRVGTKVDKPKGPQKPTTPPAEGSTPPAETPKAPPATQP
jgi:vancomycin resistance protein YoaR